MASIIISSDDGELGRLIAKETAEAMGCDVLDASLLADVAAHFEVPEKDLRRLLDPLRHSSAKKGAKRFLLTCIKSMTLERLSQQENVACVDLGAHLYVRGISHVLAVRILADPETLIERIARDEQVSTRKATSLLARRTKQRARWSLGHFGADENDPSLYDMVLTLSNVETEKAVDIIGNLAKYRKFKPMTYSRKCLNDLVLASKVSVTLQPDFPSVKVRADGAKAMVYVKCSKDGKAETAALIKEKAGQIPGVDLVVVYTASSKRGLKKLWREARSS